MTRADNELDDPQQVDSSYSTDDEHDGSMGSSDGSLVGSEGSQLTQVPRNKKTFSHFTVQDRHDVCEHLYVPRPSHGGLKVSVPSGLYPSSTHTLRAHARSTTKPRPFDPEMTPFQYTETVSVATIPAHVEQSYVAYCDVEAPKRIKDGVQLREVLSPLNFKSSIVCRVDCTKKNFKSVVNYWPKLKPRHFQETCYVLPRIVTETYVAFVDYHVDTQRKWFTTTVQLKPKTSSTTTVPNFQMLDDEEPQLVDSEDEDMWSESDEDRFDVSVVPVAKTNGEKDEGVGFEVAHNGGVEFFEGEPPHQESHRTHMLVNGYVEAEANNVKNGHSEQNGDINGNVSEWKQQNETTWRGNSNFIDTHTNAPASYNSHDALNNHYMVPSTGSHNGYMQPDEEGEDVMHL